MMYSVAPAYVCSSYLLSSVFLYFLCIYISMSLHGRENDVFEEVLLLHSRPDAAYYLSRELLQLCMCLIFAFVLSVFPILKSIVQPHYFTRAITAADVIYGGAMILFCGICGIESGDLFHPRYINRKFGYCAVILLSVLAVCKHALIQTSALFRILDIFLPPIMDSFILLGNTDSFDGKGTVLILLHMLVYSSVITAIKIVLLKRWKYRM